MSRFLYWTIVIGQEPTAFRAREAADLQPTLVQLRRSRPEAAIRWFQQGRLWNSPEEARAVLKREREAARKRPKTWRPGGTHEDPRQKYKDAKKAKWTRFKEGIRKRAEGRRERDGEGSRERDDRWSGEWRPPSDAQPRDRRSFDRRPHERRPAEGRREPRGPSDRGGPRGSRPAGSGDRRGPREARPAGTRPRPQGGPREGGGTRRPDRPPRKPRKS